eukprot:TRINITY_DN507_c0_g1_i2.p1 TRINITY_DN507_c0_g1~~TRINITY_DN507_c0_g1_i2.p1  ORF type:complete len:127 (+),score=65.69 TRINITY_DN507_c0_g1_i2:73-453(+)
MYSLLFSFFFFKQKTAYEMLRSLVGSEMCIRDRNQIKEKDTQEQAQKKLAGKSGNARQEIQVDDDSEDESEERPQAKKAQRATEGEESQESDASDEQEEEDDDDDDQDDESDDEPNPKKKLKTNRD